MKEIRNLLESKEEELGNPKLCTIIKNFQESYLQSIQESGISIVEGIHLLKQWIDLVIQQSKVPYKFDIFHQSIRQPFDYYQFGLDFIRPLVNFKASKVLGLEQVDRIIEQLTDGENVVLLANHQTEPDPQIISLLLESRYAELASQIIFVAGHRVVEDPMTIPLSMGRNLLCIYSKKYIDIPLKEKPRKLIHNQRTMQKMSELLCSGGKCIYVAPSGGRDRPNSTGRIDIAPFDPDSIEMFWLMAQRSPHLTHFYPLALDSYHLLPPPHQIKKELGEHREAHYTPIHMAFGQEIRMEHYPRGNTLNKKDKRLKRAEHIWNLVRQDYEMLLNLKK